MNSILQDIFDNVVAGNRDVLPAKVEVALNEGEAAEVILNEALIPAMAEVGELFERGDFYVPEMLVSARAMQAGLAVLKPHLIEGGVETVRTVVIGTVEGDLHDIGKNLVAIMLEGAGLEVVDLGTDVKPEKFAETARENGARIVGLSALLTTTMQNMKFVIEAIEDIGIREQVKIILGGAPVTQEFADEIGADGYAPDAVRAVNLVKSLL